MIVSTMQDDSKNPPGVTTEIPGRTKTYVYICSFISFPYFLTIWMDMWQFLRKSDPQNTLRFGSSMFFPISWRSHIPKNCSPFNLRSLRLSASVDPFLGGGQSAGSVAPVAAGVMVGSWSLVVGSGDMANLSGAMGEPGPEQMLGYWIYIFSSSVCRQPWIQTLTDMFFFQIYYI